MYIWSENLGYLRPMDQVYKEMYKFRSLFSMKKEIWHSEDKEKVHKNRKQEQRNLSESRNKEVMVILLVVPAGMYGSYLHPILFVESYACNTNILFSGNSLITFSHELLGR